MVGQLLFDIGVGGCVGHELDGLDENRPTDNCDLSTRALINAAATAKSFSRFSVFFPFPPSIIKRDFIYGKKSPSAYGCKNVHVMYV